jgi:class 3 adenylate cyclase/tetratricopeptide (TPR) repeat protein
MPVCASCGQDNPEIARFCLACGAALALVEPGREERKVVSVLFADLVGFTSRAETLDPEDVRAVLAPYWERLRSELERHGGTVEKFIGDAVMALFGAPVAHEDDPERAVRAALAIRDWAREEGGVQVRIAVTTGEALVLLGARPAEGEGMAAGDVVNTAARLQAAAPVNGILVGETTYRATRDAIDYVEHEPVVAKGKTDPVPVWEPLQARSRFGMDLEQRVLLPLVGREREVSVLVDALARATERREPQHVTLVGVPGIGKSRLVAELFAHVGSMPDLVRWRQGRALPYGDGVSFWALGEMVKAEAGIQENDSLAVARDKLWQNVSANVPEAERAWVMQHVRPLVGAESEGPMPTDAFAAWRRYFEALAEQHPLVLVFEDLHWADDGLLDFADHLAEWVTGVPLLVIGTARPEFLDRRPGWGGGKLNATMLEVSPLSDAEAAQVISAALERAVLGADTQRTLLERAGGNPLYAEQFARLYAERGGVDELPETIQGIIAARLDGLPMAEKRLLQAAAVLGKVFWADGAARLAGADPDTVATSLHSLARKGLIRRERRSVVSGDEEYAFRHVLARDVAYGQIPRAERGAKHLAAAEWLEQLGRVDDHAELVAHHYEQVLELGAASDAVLGAARRAYRQAGERALRLGAYPVAVRYLGGALALDPDVPELPSLLLGHAVARFRAESSYEALRSAIDELERLDARDFAASAAAHAANAAWRAGRHDDAERFVTRALELAGPTASAARAEALSEAGRVAIFEGHHETASAYCDEALSIAEALGLDELRATTLNTRGVVEITSGRLRDSLATYRSVIDAGLSGSAEQTRAYMNLAVVWEADGYMDESYRLHEVAIESAMRQGDKAQLLWLESSMIRGFLYLRGHWDEALERTEAFLAEVAPLGGHYLEPGLRAVRAGMLAARDETDDALRDIEITIEQLAGRVDAQTVIPTNLELARALVILGDVERARERVAVAKPAAGIARHRAPGISAENAVTAVQTGFADDWARLNAQMAETGRVWTARLIYQGRAADAAEIYDYISYPLEAAAARMLAAEQFAAAGRLAEADEQLQLGLPFFRAVGATRIVREADALLAAAS